MDVHRTYISISSLGLSIILKNVRGLETKNFGTAMLRSREASLPSTIEEKGSDPTAVEPTRLMITQTPHNLSLLDIEPVLLLLLWSFWWICGPVVCGFIWKVGYWETFFSLSCQFLSMTVNSLRVFILFFCGRIVTWL